jgi:toxin YoeB
MKEIKFTPTGFDQYNEWATLQKATFKKIGKLLKECTKTPFTGTGKPEPLKHDLKDYWSRRITDEHRLVNRVEDDNITVISCMYHYE